MKWMVVAGAALLASGLVTGIVVGVLLMVHFIERLEIRVTGVRDAITGDAKKQAS